MPLLKVYLQKFTIVLLALQILNLSICNTGFYTFNSFCPPQAQLKDSNPIDSFAEFLVENVNGYENAFPESGHQNEQQSGELKQNISFKLYYTEPVAIISPRPQPANDPQPVKRTGFCNNYSYLFWKEISHPPA